MLIIKSSGLWDRVRRGALTQIRPWQNAQSPSITMQLTTTTRVLVLSTFALGALPPSVFAQARADGANMDLKSAQDYGVDRQEPPKAGVLVAGHLRRSGAEETPGGLPVLVGLSEEGAGAGAGTAGGRKKKQLRQVGDGETLMMEKRDGVAILSLSAIQGGNQRRRPDTL